MKILKLLSKLYIIILTFFFSIQTLSGNEPVDIWKIEKIDNSIENKKEIENTINTENDT